MSLKDGAIFIADSHYPNHKAKEFISFLKAIRDRRLKTPQLILMGDIFDLLVGNSPYLKERFKMEIELLEEVAEVVEVIYLEGNHDFYLEPLFNKVKVFPIERQPLILESDGVKFALSHGDNTLTPLNYKIYTKIIREPFILKILPDSIARAKLEQMRDKKICKELENFKDIVESKIREVDSDFIIEGHFHQGKIIKNYIALPSFACSLRFATFEKIKKDISLRIFNL